MYSESNLAPYPIQADMYGVAFSIKHDISTLLIEQTLRSGPHYRPRTSIAPNHSYLEHYGSLQIISSKIKANKTTRKSHHSTRCAAFHLRGLIREGQPRRQKSPRLSKPHVTSLSPRAGVLHSRIKLAAAIGTRSPLRSPRRTEAPPWAIAIRANFIIFNEHWIWRCVMFRTRNCYDHPER